MDDKLNIPIGTLEPEKLKAVKVKCVDARVESVTKKATKEVVGEKVILMCEHPDKAEPIEMSSVKYIKGDSIKETALWYNLDKEGKLMKTSALALTLNHYKVESVSKLINLELDTILDANGYLAIKAY